MNQELSPAVKTLTCLVLCFASAGLADDFKTNDGKEYKNVTVSRVEPDGIILITRVGISKVYVTEMPKEVQQRCHYDAARSAACSSERPASQAQVSKRMTSPQQESTKAT